MRAIGRSAKRQRGVAAVEFAITLPLLLFMMLATVEVGRVLFQYNTLTKAVRDGARYVSGKALYGSTGNVSISNQIQLETQRLVAYGNTIGTGTPLLPGISPANVTVTDAGGGLVSVSAVWNYVPMLGAQLPTLGLTAPITMTIPLSASVVMRALS